MQHWNYSNSKLSMIFGYRNGGMWSGKEGRRAGDSTPGRRPPLPPSESGSGGGVNAARSKV